MAASANKASGMVRAAPYRPIMWEASFGVTVGGRIDWGLISPAIAKPLATRTLTAVTSAATCIAVGRDQKFTLDSCVDHSMRIQPRIFNISIESSGIFAPALKFEQACSIDRKRIRMRPGRAPERSNEHLYNLRIALSLAAPSWHTSVAKMLRTS